MPSRPKALIHDLDRREEVLVGPLGYPALSHCCETSFKSCRHSRTWGGQARCCIHVPLQGFHLRELPLIWLYLCDQKILSVISCQCVSYQETPLPQTPKDRSAFPAAGPGCREEEEEDGQPASKEM